MALAVKHSKTLVVPDSGVEDKVYGVDYVAADSHTVTGAGALAVQDTVTSSQISDATATGISVLTAATAAAARAAIGAGTGSGTVTSVTGSAPIASSGGATPAVSLNDAGVTYTKIQNVSATDKLLGRSTAGAGVVEEIACTAAGRALIDDADAAAQRTTLSLNNVTNDAQTKAAVVSNTAPAAGQILAGNAGGTAYAPVTVGTDATLSSAGALTIANNAVTDAKFRQGVARSVVGVTGNATANTADLQGATDTVLRVNGAGTAVAFGAIDLSKVAAATGVLQAASFPALTGDVTTVAGALAATIGAGRVTRAMLAADAKNWTLLGTATATNAVRSGTITWAGTFEELWFEYFIAGYSNTAIGRLIVGPTAGLSETATNHCCSLIEGVTLTATSVSIPGWPTAVTVNNVERYGSMFVKNVAGQVKRMWGHGNHAGTAATAVPLQMLFGGLMSDATNAINKAELAVYAAITGAVISAITFTSATLNVWGRHAD